MQSINLLAQISPGDLTKAHAKLEGMSNCTKCHVLGEKVENTKCLDCHSEIKTLINLNRGFHSQEKVQIKECRNCHSEHNGRNFRIVNFQQKDFDHKEAKFELNGKHSKLKCEECHQTKFIQDAELKKRKGTYLGLVTACFSCHEDVHQKSLGEDCKSCHGNDSFKPAVNFNHDTAKFKLTGEHQKVDCIKCHIKEKRNGKDFQKFTGIDFASCESCHEDIHKGKFGKDCQSCHSTTSFKSINQGSFNHDKTNFPLVGKHRIVNCKDCHKRGIKYKLKYKRCTDCHEDYHKGEFKVKNVIMDCNNCHNELGFHPSLFTIDKHNQLQFKLSGGHLAIPCEACHHKSKDWHFKNIGEKCIDCHKNIHEGEITKNFMPDDDCTVCHKTESWSSISFDHDKTKFKLLGKHKDVKCADCHRDKTEMADSRYAYKFVSLKSDCEGCHKDIHFGQFIVNGKTDCGKCHAYNDWKPEKFDHDKTRFSLAGAHQKLKCSSCHKQALKNGNTFIKFKLEDFKCAFCHSS